MRKKGDVKCEGRWMRGDVVRKVAGVAGGASESARNPRQ